MKETGKLIRITIDTNIFISALLGSRNCCEIYNLFADSKIDVLMSLHQLAELNDTIRNPKLSPLFKNEDVKKLNKLLEEDAEWILPEKEVSACRDPKDNFILDCAVAGKANFIVTGDKDLLSLKSFRKIRIITPKQFLKIKL